MYNSAAMAYRNIINYVVPDWLEAKIMPHNLTKMILPVLGNLYLYSVHLHLN